MNGLTMKSLREFIKNNDDIPDDEDVLIERVTDIHFENKVWHDGSIIKGWDVYLQKGYHYYSTEKFNNEMKEEIGRREKGIDTEYPKIENPKDYIIPLTDELKEQFYHGWCITKNKEGKILIYSHY